MIGALLTLILYILIFGLVWWLVPPFVRTLESPAPPLPIAGEYFV